MQPPPPRQVLQRLASQFLNRQWLRAWSESKRSRDTRSVFAIWKGVIDGTVCSSHSRVAASENYRTVSAEATKTARVSKEHCSKRLRKNDHGIFHTKGSLQKLSAKFSIQLAESLQQLQVAQNEYVLMLAGAKAHLEHYYQRELPAIIQTLDGDVYEQLRDQLLLISRTELEVCQGTRDLFQDVAEASAQVCREQHLHLFLQDSPAFSATATQLFPPAGTEQVVLQRMESRRQQVSDAEVPTMEKRMEEVKENIRKAEISKVKAEARMRLLRLAGFDVDPWLASAMGQALDEMEQEWRLSEARGSESGSTPTAEEFDPAEFEDYDDDTELFEDTTTSPGVTHCYPSSCSMIFPYQPGWSGHSMTTRGRAQRSSASPREPSFECCPGKRRKRWTTASGEGSSRGQLESSHPWWCRKSLELPGRLSRICLLPHLRRAPLQSLIGG